MIDQQEMGADEESDDSMDEGEETFVDAMHGLALGCVICRSFDEILP